MSALREMARQHAQGDEPGVDGEHTGPAPAAARIVSEPLPDIEYTDPIATVEQVPVAVAFARVMADVQSIGKKDRRDDSGGRYQFRGVDRVVNAVGPALRRHGLIVVPVRVYDVEYREAKTTNGKTMQEVTLKVQWQVIGPMGDYLPQLLGSAGQATDTADKGTSKAVSVAQRVLFLSALHIPTEDPDIDRGHERGERPTVQPGQYRDEIASPRTSAGRLRQMRVEIVRHGIAGAIVTNEVGDDEQLLVMLDRIGKERAAAEGTPGGEG